MRGILYVSQDGLLAAVPFSLYDAQGYPLVCQVDQLKSYGLRLNAVDWWLQAVIAGKGPDWAYQTLLEAFADNSEVLPPRKDWDAQMALLYTVAAKGERDPDCWVHMLEYLRGGAIQC